MSFTPAQFATRPLIKKGDTFGYSFKWIEDDSPLDLSVLSGISVKLFKSNATIFEHTLASGLTISTATGSPADSNDLLSGVASDTVMDIGTGAYYLEVVFTFADGTISTYVSSAVTIIGNGQAGTPTDYVITITNSTGEASAQQSTSVLAQAIQAKVDTETLKDETETIAAQALVDINAASDSAIATIGSEQTDAIAAIETARDAGITAVESAQSDGVDAINSAKTTALTEIAVQVTAAETAASTATTQAGIATTKAGEASSSATTATTQAGIATTKASEASTSASNAATSETNAETAYQNTVDELPAKRIEDEAFNVNENYKIREMSLASLPTPKQLISNKADLKNPNLSVVRDSTGTVFNSLGNLETLATDTLRYDFSPSTALYSGVLIEPLITNLLPSSVPDAGVPTGWSVGFGTGTYTHTVVDEFSPFYSGHGAINHSVTVSGRSFLQRNLSLLASTDYTLTVYFDKDNSSVSSGGTNIVGIINLSDATFSSGSAFKNITEIPADGKLEISFTTGSDTEGQLRIGLGILADSVGEVVFTGWQLTATTQDASYIPTNSAAVSKDADLLTFSDVSELVKDTQNSFKFTFTTAGNGTQTLFDLYSDVNNRIYLQRNTSNEIHFKIVTSGTEQCDLNLGAVADYTEATICVGFEADNVKGCLEGGTVQSDSSVTLPSFDTLHIGRDYNDTNFWNGWIKNAQSYLKMLSETEIQTLSGTR